MSDFIITQKPQQIVKIRESGIELLRCLAIFFVVVIHEINTFFLNADHLFVFLSQIITWPAIFCFSFITGYFLIQQNQSENKIKRFVFLTLEIVFWRITISLLVLLIFTLANQNPAIDFFDGVKTIVFNLVDVRSWYFWAILFVYLVFPFFNAYLKQHYLKGKKILKWLIIFLLFLSLIATLSDLSKWGFSLYTDHYTLVVVLLSALMGAYWHFIEQDKKIQGNWKWQLCGLTGLLSVYLINFSCGWWLKDKDTALSYLNLFWYFSGFFYFLIFKNFKFRSKFINWWASLSWWIYLLHNGEYLPRGKAVDLIRLAQLDPYTSTILTILLCYLLTIVLTLIAQNIDKWLIKPHLLLPLKKWHQKRKHENKKTLEKK